MYLVQAICCAAPQPIMRHIVSWPPAASGKPAPLLSSMPSQKNRGNCPTKTVTPCPHPWRKFMKRCAKDFIRSLGLSGLIIAAASVSAVAQKKYHTGETDNEIKIGNILPYTRPPSTY